MKVFTSLFSKSDRPSKGAQPLVARRNGRNPYSLFNLRSKYVLLCSSLLKKNGNDFLTFHPNGQLIPNILPYKHQLITLR